MMSDEERCFLGSCGGVGHAARRGEGIIVNQKIYAVFKALDSCKLGLAAET
jgi:hypothetical protein